MAECLARTQHGHNPRLSTGDGAAFGRNPNCHRQPGEQRRSNEFMTSSLAELDWDAPRRDCREAEHERRRSGDRRSCESRTSVRRKINIDRGPNRLEQSGREQREDETYVLRCITRRTPPSSGDSVSFQKNMQMRLTRFQGKSLMSSEDETPNLTGFKSLEGTRPWKANSTFDARGDVCFIGATKRPCT